MAVKKKNIEKVVDFIDTIHLNDWTIFNNTYMGMNTQICSKIEFLLLSQHIHTISKKSGLHYRENRNTPNLEYRRVSLE